MEKFEFYICKDFTTLKKKIGQYIIDNSELITDLNIEELEKFSAYEVYYTIYDKNYTVSDRDLIIKAYFFIQDASMLHFVAEE